MILNNWLILYYELYENKMYNLLVIYNGENLGVVLTIQVDLDNLYILSIEKQVFI